MPFLGRDWRSGGDEWLKTEKGWEKVKIRRWKIFENLNENVVSRCYKRYDPEESKQIACTTQPHIFIVKNSTKEQKCQTSLSEAFSKLDMSGAARDIKRFSYVRKLLEVIIRNKFSSLSGSAQRCIFQILQETVQRVIQTKNDVKLMKTLLNDTHKALNKGKYLHVGSRSLWNMHLNSLQQMMIALEELHIDTPTDESPSLCDLPDDCMREILYKLSDREDIINLGQTCDRTSSLTKEDGLWRDLCVYYFDEVQMAKVLKNNETIESVRWSCLYERLVKRFGFKEDYTELLNLCKHCNALYWSCHGHPCPYPDLEKESASLSPVMCMELFCS
ncbi:DgyrCDS2640 [Dimorphilus gyrociliatus]|uniref:DgyrCDS2640 n=1 Tax=Dimorphilus gyrociliatus TaxID=2664684 RepID=A0A7I8VAW2_9ANNE|nr:DgyrCDS2640 [Dimorphilus gyrociliatus]